MESHDKAHSARSSLSYRELRDNDIRLLHLHPSRHIDAPIYTILHTVNLNDNSVYKALSYVWGSPSLRSNISVDGHLFEAATNLTSALRHLRGARTVRILWIDAICINQPNDEERSRQVQMMSSIYRSATEVIAWLREREGKSDEAMKLLRDWGSALAKLGINSIASFTSTLNDPLSERGWAAVCDLYNRPYWDRLWVVQEFLLARKVTLACGLCLADGNDLFTDVFIHDWMIIKPTANLMQDLSMKPIWDALCAPPVEMNRSLIHDLVKWKARVRTGLSDGNFFGLLFDMSFRRCADERDHLFAAIGFCTASSPKTAADYSIGLERAMMMFARGYIMQSRLEMLCYAGIGYTGGEWVNVAILDDKNDRSTSMSILGAVMDTIEDVLEGFTDWEAENDDHWTTLIFKDGVTTAYVNGRFSFTKHCRKGLYDDSTTTRGQLSFALLTGPYSDKAAHSSGIGSFFSESENVGNLSGRTWLDDNLMDLFFTTSRGYMGTGPPYAMTGDKVCVIQGSNVPFFLRPDGDGYLLVGEAFVLGMMDGEYKDGFYGIETH